MATPYSLISVDVTGSTQDDARGAFTGYPVLVVAASQTEGRGRGAARWENAPRAMAASLCVAPHWPPAALPLVPLLAGVAAVRVLDCRLKWPNDVVDGDRKLGGILAEAREGVLTVGFGLNLWWPEPPPEAAGWLDWDPGPDRRIEIADGWASELLRLISQGPSGWPRSEYSSRCSTLGKQIEWREGSEAQPPRRGRAVAIDADGGLVVETPDGALTLHSGAVRHIRPG